MNIVIPMAGRGSRFLRAGFTTPKPLIVIRGEPMYSWALKSLPLALGKRLLFICLEEHLSSGELEQDIATRFGEFDPLVLPVREVTEGQACTVLLAKEYIDNTDPLLIYNADTYFESSLGEMLQTLPDDVQGVVSVFRATDDKWSFARVNEQGLITEVAEKNPISCWATTGMYHFSQGRDFVYAAEEMISKGLRSNNEYYVGPVYNLLIAEGKRIVPDYAETIGCMGTPEDLETFKERFLG